MKKSTQRADAFDASLYGMLNLETSQEIKPNVIDEHKVKIFDGKKEIEFTVYEIDATSSMQILVKNLKWDNVQPEPDIIGLAIDALRYQVKEIDDAEEFMSNSATRIVIGLLKEIINLTISLEGEIDELFKVGGSI